MPPVPFPTFQLVFQAAFVYARAANAAGDDQEGEAGCARAKAAAAAAVAEEEEEGEEAEDLKAAAAEAVRQIVRPPQTTAMTASATRARISAKAYQPTTATPATMDYFAPSMKSAGQVASAWVAIWIVPPVQTSVILGCVTRPRMPANRLLPTRVVFAMTATPVPSLSVGPAHVSSAQT